MAEVLYERDELPAAKRHATRGVTLCRRWPTPNLWPPALASSPGSGRRRAIRPARSEAIGQAQRIPLSPQVVALHNPVPMWRARLLLVNREDAKVPLGG